MELSTKYMKKQSFFKEWMYNFEPKNVLGHNFQWIRLVLLIILKEQIRSLLFPLTLIIQLRYSCTVSYTV